MGRKKYREGDVFAVPLKDGGYGVGLVARAKRGIYLGYFFSEVHAELPELDSLALDRDDTVEVTTGGDQALVEGRWPILGQLPGWNRDDWPTPWFVMYSPPGQEYRVLSSYYPDDPTESFGLKDIKVSPEEADGLPRKFGSPWPGLELFLNQLLHHDPRPLARVRIVPGPPAPELKPQLRSEPVPEEAVRVYFGIPDVGLPAADEAQLEFFEEALDAKLRMKKLGYVDGNEQGEGEFVLYLYGPDRHAIWAEVQRMLKYSPVAVKSVYLREADLDAEPTIFAP